MSLDQAKAFVTWITNPQNKTQFDQIQDLTTTEDRLKYAAQLGYVFSLAEHDQAYKEFAAERGVTLTDADLENVSGGLPNPNFNFKDLIPVMPVYAAFPRIDGFKP